MPKSFHDLNKVHASFRKQACMGMAKNVGMDSEWDLAKHKPLEPINADLNEPLRQRESRMCRSRENKSQLATLRDMPLRAIFKAKT